MVEVLDNGSWTPTEPRAPGNVSTTTSSVGISDGLACPAADSCAVIGNYQEASGASRQFLSFLSSGAWSTLEIPLPTGAAGEPQLHTPLSCPTIDSCQLSYEYRDSSSAWQGAFVSAPPTVTLQSQPAPFIRTRSASVAFVVDDPDDGSTGLHTTCTLDGLASACTSPFTASNLADGPHTLAVQTMDSAGNGSAVVKATWIVDTVAPTATLHALPAFGLASAVPLSWSGSDARSGIASFDLRYTRAAYTGTFSPWVYPASWQHTTAVKATFVGIPPGYDYCFSLRSQDKAGNVSAWTTSRCVARPVDDRSMTLSAGWSRATNSAYYLSTYTSTTHLGATLTRSGTLIDRIALVATTCSGCGKLGIYVNGGLFRTVSLYSATTHRQVIFGLPAFSYRKATVVLKVLSGTKTIQVDGLGLSRT